ncbi:MAG TPA: hypothetical protein DEO65_07815 [Bacillus bacterium]|uniref:hypothetical protein n=1 Tax=Siminovitchia fordii TaxID=254759 RepID=UPI000376ED82|nr:hypothetical protein [Bacillus sp. (in: firmicutes)]
MGLSSRKNQQENLEDCLKEEDPFGLDEDLEIVIFRCLDCNTTDEVPEYIIGEFSVDLNKGEEVKLHCPKCNSTMIDARENPID